MNPLDNPYSKESILARSPGGNRKSKATNKDKGESFEKEVKQAFGKKARRNHQGRSGGGLSNPDVTPMRGWHCEVKKTKRLDMAEWLRTLKQETPSTDKPMLVFEFEEEPWITVKLKQRLNFASDQIEELGGEVYFP